MEHIIRVILCVAVFSLVRKVTKKILRAALFVLVLWLALRFLL